METIISVLLIIVGFINAFPVIGILGAARLSALYGIPVQEPNLLILLRHRAVLFGLVGGFSFYAAFRPELQVLAMIAALISMLSFIGLALQVGGYNAQLKKVIVADVIGLILLALAAMLYIAVPQPG
jgi:hypothetical protein